MTATTTTMLNPAAPRRCLSVLDAVAIIVGMVIGSMIFRAPSWVAGNASSVAEFVGFWIAGGVISLIGALCYAELAATYPDAGGDYHYLWRAFGPNLAFLFAWARLAVIQTGSIAIQAFVIGDYAAALFTLGPASSATIAASVVVALTALNIAGIREAKWAQIVLTTCEVLGVCMLVVAGFSIAHDHDITGATATAGSGGAFNAGAVGMAMVFVLLTYGGWNEATYLSAEVRGTRGVAAALFWSIGIVTVVYVLANLAMVAGMGLDGVAKSNAIGADLAGRAFGDVGARLISIIVVISALSTANATVITGARTNYALGRDFPLLARLGRWDTRGETPTNGLILQGFIALALVIFGGLARSGFSAMVAYTAPVFWFFFLLATMSLIVLRRRDPNAARPFRVPLYPLTPIVFIAVCAFMFYSSVRYAGVWSLIGLVVLAIGMPLLLIAKPAVREDARRGFEPVLAKG